MTGKEFEALRNQHNIKRSHLARVMGVCYLTVWRWEKDLAYPPSKMAVKFLKLYVKSKQNKTKHYDAHDASSAAS